MKKLIEIHRNGINAHHKEYSYYVLDYQTKRVVANNLKTYEEALDKADDYAFPKYINYNIIIMW